jgi:hypothetical protein
MLIRKLKQFIDIAASIACLAIFVILIYGIVRETYSPRGTAPHGDNKPNISPGLQVGTRFPDVAGLSYQEHDRSVLFFLDHECPHCIQSLPVYRRLFGVRQNSSSTGQAANVFLIGLFANNKSKEDFVSLGFPIPSKANVSFFKYQIAATPTAVVVDRSGRIEDFWVGELQPESIERLTRMITSQ